MVKNGKTNIAEKILLILLIGIIALGFYEAWRIQHVEFLQGGDIQKAVES